LDAIVQRDLDRMTKAKRVAIYTRVPTDGQSVENQRRELLAVAERRGWKVVQEYSDYGISALVA
jgi:DNA invertase Pin-like site-specific DNA recombinase